MMNCMRAAPEIVRRQSQNADDAADPIVGAPIGKESTVAAVMLNHEEANQKPGRRDGDEERRPPITEGEGQPRRDPQRDERKQRYRQFGNAAQVARLAIAAQALSPMS